MNNSTTRFWSGVAAEDFDLKTQSSGRLQGIQRVADLARPHLMQEERFSVDLGCGTGLLASVIGDHRIVGIDFSGPLLAIARQRMDRVIQQSIFEVQFETESVHNVFTLFVMDDYPSEQKETFFSRVFSWLKPAGHFFLAAYSPNDERMGKLKRELNRKLRTDFTIYLEGQSFYEDKLQRCGFSISTAEVVEAMGIYQAESEEVEVRREFILMVAEKPHRGH